MIAGSDVITVSSKWIGNYLSIPLSMSVGVAIFFVCIHVTPSLRDIRIIDPMRFMVGPFLGAGSMIQSHLFRYFGKSMAAMFLE